MAVDKRAGDAPCVWLAIAPAGQKPAAYYRLELTEDLLVDNTLPTEAPVEPGTNETSDGLDQQGKVAPPELAPPRVSPEELARAKAIFDGLIKDAEMDRKKFRSSTRIAQQLCEPDGLENLRIALVLIKDLWNGEGEACLSRFIEGFLGGLTELSRLDIPFDQETVKAAFQEVPFAALTCYIEAERAVLTKKATTARGPTHPDCVQAAVVKQYQQWMHSAGSK